ncbi:MAG: acyl-CoA dehydrogenase family protein, partial [Propionibacteriaceae bacterium]|nr:acyl-CoA dehydrogenase family protein [Propionibacteriaceae bacterium]
MSVDEIQSGERVDEKVARQVAEAAREQQWERPSFAKGLYMGNFDWDLIHPHPQPEPAATARGVAFMARLREAIEDIDASAIEREARVPDEAIKALRDVGAFGMKIPVEYGGVGLNLADYGRSLTLVGSLNPSLGALLSAHQSIGVPEPVKMFGTEEQKRSFLPRCAAGAISAFLLTENDVGSDPARLGTTATPSQDGKSYTINGSKLWTTNGTVAELLVVLAAVPSHQLPDGTTARGGISAFVVEADSPGIVMENRCAFMGLRGIENSVTRFHDVEVPLENRLGKEGAGLKIALSTLNTGRLSIPAMCLGAGKWALKIAREWSAIRVQWGKPVGEHEAIGKKIAYIAANTFAMEAVFELSAALADAGMKDVRIEAALAKLFCSEVAYKIADELLQIRGGRGYETAASQQARGERAVPVEQLLRDMRINRIFEGSTEIMHLLIAREAVDAHLKAAGDLANKDANLSAKAKAAVGASGFYAKWLPTLAVGSGLLPNAYAEHGPLAKYLRFIERASRRLARHTFAGMASWQAGMENHQAFLGRVVDVGAELFAMAACISRVELMRSQDPDNSASAEFLAMAFCEQAEHRCETLFRDLWANSDKTDRKLSKGVLAGDFAWLESGIVDTSEGTGDWIAAWSS